MYFHCDRFYLEDSSKLVDALATQGIVAHISEDQARIDACVDEHPICIFIRDRRFRDRLWLTDIKGRGIDMISPEFKQSLETVDAAMAAGDIRPIRYPKQRLKMARIADLFVRIGHALGWTIISDPIEAEIEYVTAHFPTDSVTAEIIDAIRNEQTQLEDAIAEQQFEEEPAYNRKIYQLLNRLYEYCAS